MGNLFSSPKPAPVQRMPDAEDPALRRARQARVGNLLANSTSEQARTMSRNTIAGATPASTATQSYIAGKLGASN